MPPRLREPISPSGGDFGAATTSASPTGLRASMRRAVLGPPSIRRPSRRCSEHTLHLHSPRRSRPGSAPRRCTFLESRLRRRRWTSPQKDAARLVDPPRLHFRPRRCFLRPSDSRKAPNFEVLDVMSPGASRREGLCFDYATCVFFGHRILRSTPSSCDVGDRAQGAPPAFASAIRPRSMGL